MLTRAASAVDPLVNRAALEQLKPGLVRAGSETRNQAVDSNPVSTLVQENDVEAPQKQGLSAVENQVDEEQKTAELNELTQKLNQRLDPSLNLRFLQDEETGLDFFQIVDKQSGEVVRQYPPEELIEATADLREVSGLIFSNEV